jgi:hypothetical protein
MKVASPVIALMSDLGNRAGTSVRMLTAVGRWALLFRRRGVELRGKTIVSPQR